MPSGFPDTAGYHRTSLRVKFAVIDLGNQPQEGSPPVILLTAKSLCACKAPQWLQRSVKIILIFLCLIVQNAQFIFQAFLSGEIASKHEKKYSEPFFFFLAVCLVESRIPDQGSNSGHVSESPES